LFEAATSRSEVVCTFLALLEMIKMKKLLCVQSEHFGEIDITRAPETHAIPPSEPSAEAPAEAQP
jgi:segregation and condensation protein A